MSSVVLGIETSGSWCSAALVRGVERFARRDEVGNGHTDRLLAMIDAVLDDASLALDDCDAVAFSAGPGSFTGLRVGCAVAQGLAFGAALRVAPVGTLDAIAHAVPRTGVTGRSILVVQDARMGEVYWSLVERNDDRQRVIVDPVLSHPSRLCELLRAVHGTGTIDVGCGSAWALYPDHFDGLVTTVVDDIRPDAVAVAELGVVVVLEDRLVPAEAAAPLYVRNDVARTTAERQALAARRAMVEGALP